MPVCVGLVHPVNPVNSVERGELNNPGFFVKHIRLFVLVGLLIVLMTVSPSCASTAKPMETEADFIGFITEIHPNGERDVIGQIFIESHADKIVTKYIITITDETLIFQQSGSNLHQVTFTAMEDKQWVRIWFSGPVIESFPVQGDSWTSCD